MAVGTQDHAFGNLIREDRHRQGRDGATSRAKTHILGAGVEMMKIQDSRMTIFLTDDASTSGLMGVYKILPLPGFLPVLLWVPPSPGSLILPLFFNTSFLLQDRLL
jgi:hypothetical protein